MKVIFLDLDGVLVPAGQTPGIFDGYLARNLKKIVEATGAEIVLSSDWRRHRTSVAKARRNLQAYGLDFIDCTPSLSPRVAQRPTEILLWKQDFCSSGQRQIDAWIAIDDRNLAEEQDGQELQGHVVRTRPKVGLDRSAADKCIQLLLAQEDSPNGPTPKISRSCSFASNSTADTLAGSPNYGTVDGRVSDVRIEDKSVAATCWLPAVSCQRPAVSSWISF